MKSALCTRCHNALWDSHYLSVDNSDTQIEQQCSGDNNRWPGDIYHPDFLEGYPAYFDVSVQNTFLPYSEFGYCSWCSCQCRRTGKDSKYDSDIFATGRLFYFESLGHWTPTVAVCMFWRLAIWSVLLSSLLVSQAVCNLHEQLSVCVYSIFNTRMVWF